MAPPPCVNDRYPQMTCTFSSVVCLDRFCMSASKITPMLRQYLAIKEQYADALLLYRMGDFYEMFFEDAEVAARTLDITLTSRNKHAQTPVPMCGVPCKAVQGYIARLLENGFKVAICDQVEEPSQAKGLVRREVVRVITPGMIIENALLEASSNNYILALARLAECTGLATLDLSTGSFRVTETDSFAVAMEEARRIAPREILLPRSAADDDGTQRWAVEVGDTPVTYLEDEAFGLEQSRQRLQALFGTLSLEGFGCAHLTAGVAAAGALVRYLLDTQKQQIDHLNGLETYRLDNYLWVDERSCQNLELLRSLSAGNRKGTLIAVLDRTVTPMGARLLKHWLRYPLLDLSTISARHDAVAEALAQHQARGAIRDALRAVQDLERLRARLAMGHGNALDLLALRDSFQVLPELEGWLAKMNSDLLRLDEPCGPLLVLGQAIAEAIRDDASASLNEGGFIKTGYSPELDALIRLGRDGKGWLAQLEAREKELTGVGALKVRYNKVFGYYIEVPKARAASVPGHYVRKQTLVNAERYITDELKTFEEKVLHAEERRAALELELFGTLRGQVLAEQQRIQRAAASLARIDVLASLSEVAATGHYCRPRMNAAGIVHIEDGRHPVVERVLRGERFVPNTIHLDDQTEQVLIITGPNMAGKSTVLRQVALTVILAQMGSFVPAAAADIAVTDRIFTRVGALDNLAQGHSTFMVEMQETANILNNASARSLVVLDEIGRGTSTFDGLSIAWAVAEYLHNLKGSGVKTLFATHYHELTELARQLPRVKNYNIAVKEWNDEIIFLRKLVAGGTNRSYGIQVARLAGIPPDVIVRSKKILARIEQGEHVFPAVPHEEPGRRGPVQLGLFPSPGDEVRKMLDRIDVARTTPLEALNLLQQLKSKMDAAL
jgi:DNA mismatch repair protein MutS